MLTPQRRAQMDAVLGKTGTSTRSVLTPERRAQMDKVLGRNQIPTDTGEFVKGTIKNIPKSGVQAVKDVGSFVANLANPNPEKNSAVNMARLAQGAGQMLDPTKGNKIANFSNKATSYMMPWLSPMLNPKNKNYESYPKNVGSFYKDRYGSADAIKKTAYNDPVGVGLDIATVATGVGGLAKGGAMAGSKAGMSAGVASNMTKAGNTLTRAGMAFDPLVMGAKVASKPFSMMKRPLASLSDTLGSKAQKFNKTDIEAIRTATGTDPLTFARREGLPISATKKGVEATKKATQVLQDQYNAMVRTGKKVSRRDYAEAIKAQADKLLAKADTPEIRSLAKQLYQEAQYQLRQKSKYMTDDFLTDTKSAAFTGASKNQLSSPLISGREEQLGRAGVEVLDKYAPGSKDLGKKLRGYRTYLEKLDSQANTGKGTQLFNLFKPAGAGLAVGAGVGSFIPGIGNVAGAVMGGVLTTVINSPRFLAKASNVLYNTSKTGGLSTAQKAVLLKMYNAGRVGRVFNPSDQEKPIVQTILQMPQFREEVPSSVSPKQTGLFGGSGGLFTDRP